MNYSKARTSMLTAFRVTLLLAVLGLPIVLTGCSRLISEENAAKTVDPTPEELEMMDEMQGQ